MSVSTLVSVLALMPECVRPAQRSPPDVSGFPECALPFSALDSSPCPTFLIGRFMLRLCSADGRAATAHCKGEESIFPSAFRTKPSHGSVLGINFLDWSGCRIIFHEQGTFLAYWAVQEPVLAGREHFFRVDATQHRFSGPSGGRAVVHRQDFYPRPPADGRDRSCKPGLFLARRSRRVRHPDRTGTGIGPSVDDPG